MKKRKILIMLLLAALSYREAQSADNTTYRTGINPAEVITSPIEHDNGSLGDVYVATEGTSGIAGTVSLSGWSNHAYALYASRGTVFVGSEAAGISGTIATEASDFNAFAIYGGRESLGDPSLVGVSITGGIAGTITATTGNQNAFGIWAPSTQVSITGDISGSISATAGSYRARGIAAGGDLTIDGSITGEVTAIAEGAPSSHVLDYTNAALYTEGNLSIGDITGKVETILMYSGYSGYDTPVDAYGIFVDRLGDATIGSISGIVRATGEQTNNIYGIRGGKLLTIAEIGETGLIEARGRANTSTIYAGSEGVAITGDMAGTIRAYKSDNVAYNSEANRAFALYAHQGYSIPDYTNGFRIGGEMSGTIEALTSENGGVVTAVYGTLAVEGDLSGTIRAVSSNSIATAINAPILALSTISPTGRIYAEGDSAYGIAALTPYQDLADFQIGTIEKNSNDQPAIHAVGDYRSYAMRAQDGVITNLDGIIRADTPIDSDSYDFLFAYGIQQSKGAFRIDNFRGAVIANGEVAEGFINQNKRSYVYALSPHDLTIDHYYDTALIEASGTGAYGIGMGYTDQLTINRLEGKIVAQSLLPATGTASASAISRGSFELGVLSPLFDAEGNQLPNIEAHAVASDNAYAYGIYLAGYRMYYSDNHDYYGYTSRNATQPSAPPNLEEGQHTLVITDSFDGMLTTRAATTEPSGDTAAFAVFNTNGIRGSIVNAGASDPFERYADARITGTIEAIAEEGGWAVALASSLGPMLMTITGEVVATSGTSLGDAIHSFDTILPPTPYISFDTSQEIADRISVAATGKLRGNVKLGAGNDLLTLNTTRLDGLPTIEGDVQMGGFRLIKAYADPGWYYNWIYYDYLLPDVYDSIPVIPYAAAPEQDDDTLSMLANSRVTGTVEMGAGDDSITMEGNSRIEGNVDLGLVYDRATNVSEIKGIDAHGAIFVLYTSTDPGVLFEENIDDPGADTLFMDGAASIGGTVSFGAGNDTFTMQGVSSLSGNVDMGQDDDTMTIKRSLDASNRPQGPSLDGTTTLRFGSGNDRLVLDNNDARWYSMDLGSVQQVLFEEGDDAIRLTKNVTIDDLTLISGGAGSGDTIELAGWTGEITDTFEGWEEIKVIEYTEADIESAVLSASSGEELELYIDANSTIRASGNSPGIFTINGDLVNEGLIEMRDLDGSSDDADDRLTVTGTYRGGTTTSPSYLGLDINFQSGSQQTDLLRVGDATGTTMLLIRNVAPGNIINSAAGLLVVEVTGSATPDAGTFRLSDSNDFGTADVTLVQVGNDWYIVVNTEGSGEGTDEDPIPVAPGDPAPPVIDASGDDDDPFDTEPGTSGGDATGSAGEASPQLPLPDGHESLQSAPGLLMAMGRESVPRFHERQAYDRLQRAGTPEQGAWWVRSTGTRRHGESRSGGSSASYEGYSGNLQAGSDLLSCSCLDTNYRFGIYAGTGMAEADLQGRSGGVTATSMDLGLYASTEQRGDWYLEGVLFTSRYEFDVDFGEGRSSGSETWGWGASLEGGLSWRPAESLLLEPQAQLLYQSMGAWNIDTPESRARVHEESSLLGRIGLTGTLMAEGWQVAPFFELNAMQEFGEVARVSYAAADTRPASTYRIETDRLWMGGAIGLSNRNNSPAALKYYVKAGIMAGVDGFGSRDYTLTVGVRQSW